jgi:hypothetical protein
MDNNENEEQSKVKCDDCGMIFKSEESMLNHKEKFCTGPTNENKLINDGDDNDYDNNNEDYLLDDQINNDNFDNKNNNQTPVALQNKTTPRENNLIDFQSPGLTNQTPNNNKNPKSPPIISSKKISNKDNSPINTTRYSYDNNDGNKSAINDIKSYKNKKKIEQSIKDREDQLVRDSIRDEQLISSFDKNNYGDGKILNDKNLNLNTAELGINAYINRDEPYKNLMKEVS